MRFMCPGLNLQKGGHQQGAMLQRRFLCLIGEPMGVLHGVDQVGDQSFRSRRDDATSHAGSHRAPVWNQEFQFLVEEPTRQVRFFGP